MKKYIKLNKLSIIFICIFCGLITSCNNNYIDDPISIKEQLNTPTPRIDNDILTWNKISKASSYNIYINDEIVLNTMGYSYIFDLKNKGNYKINIQACTNDTNYLNSKLSNELYYTIDKEKIDTPILVYDGTNILFEDVSNAVKYDVYLNNVLTTDLNIIKENNKNKIVFNNLESGEYQVKVQACANPNSNSFGDSNISDNIIYLEAYKDKIYNAVSLDNIWKKENEIAIQHIIEPEILIWTDVRGNDLTTLENYLYLSNDVKTIVLTGYKTSSYGAMELKVSIRKYNDDSYIDLLCDNNLKTNGNSEKIKSYYFVLPDDFENGNYYVKTTYISSGNYQAQFVIRSISLENRTTYIEPVIPMNKNVIITSVSTLRNLSFSNDLGYLSYDNTPDTLSDCVLKIVPDSIDGCFRIMNQNGMYLSLGKFLRSDNVVNDFIIERPYDVNDQGQIWFARGVSSVGGINTFTILSYANVYYESGIQKNLVLDCPYMDFNNACLYYDIEHIDLQFIVTEYVDEVDFKQSGYLISSLLDLTKSVMVSFMGRNNVFDITNSCDLVVGDYITNKNNITEYLWTFEESIDGYYYIKLNDGKYLYTVKHDGYYTVQEAEKISNDSRFLWKLDSRGGMLFVMSNKFVNEDSHSIQYIVRHTDGSVRFYIDLGIHGDQILKIYN